MSDPAAPGSDARRRFGLALYLAVSLSRNILRRGKRHSDLVDKLFEAIRQTLNTPSVAFSRDLNNYRVAFNRFDVVHFRCRTHFLAPFVVLVAVHYIYKIPHGCRLSTTNP